jgi:ribosomal protein L37AE/L43A
MAREQRLPRACFGDSSVIEEESDMAAHAGEKAQETGDFRCSRCHRQTHVTKGRTIAKCPHCGNSTFDTRYHEPGSKR